MSEDSKVFDVAKPGEAKPDTGSKPMVVGHKLMKDPSVNEPEEKESLENQPIAQTSKKTISPISDQEKETEKTTTENSDDSKESEKTDTEVRTDEEQEKTESQPTSDDVAVGESTEKSKEDIEKEKNKEALDNEENLQKIISDKTYFVSIDEASYSSAKTFFKTFIAVSLISVIVLVVLIDLEVIDLGVSLPFDIL